MSETGGLKPGYFRKVDAGEDPFFCTIWCGTCGRRFTFHNDREMATLGCEHWKARFPRRLRQAMMAGTHRRRRERG